MKKQTEGSELFSYVLICLFIIGATLFFIWWNSPVENTLPEVYGVMQNHYYAKIVLERCYWYNGNSPMGGDTCYDCTKPYGTVNSGSCWHLSSGTTSDYNANEGAS